MHPLPERLRPPEDNYPPKATWGQGVFWLLCGALWFGLILGACSQVRGQDVLAPCYTPAAARATMKATPRGQEAHVMLVLNVNSGPGWTSKGQALKRDPEHAKLVREIEGRGFPWAAYIDCVGGGVYSPFIHVRDGAYVVVTDKPVRVKTAQELRNERDAWMIYGPSDAYLFDDVRPGMSHLWAEVASWQGSPARGDTRMHRVILNPGTSFEPPGILPGSVVVISEQAKAWPRKLTAWERSNPQRCAVIGLSISGAGVSVFVRSTAGLAYRWASPLNDAWTKGQTAYHTSTPYLEALLNR
jgi:hypothetical protein